MEKIEIMDHCYCERPIEPLTPDSTQEIIIRRYVGGQGHLVDVAYHPQCYLDWLSLDGILKERLEPK